ncbi:MAG: MarR family transcriptional regulator [Gemmatimonadales bacterium]|nr:MarR family transcriptional regulator [Gemmatimonadales bacterium]
MSDVSEIDKVLRENIRIMAQVITEVCQRSTRKQVSPSTLSRNQFYILNILGTSGEFLISDLARSLDISPAAASKNIDRLEQMEFVERRARPEDRRSLEVCLLPKGKAIVDEFKLVTIEKQAPLLAQFSAEEKVVLLDLLRRIVKYTVNEEHNTELICLQCGGACGEECVVKDGMGPCALPPKQ